MPTQHSVAQPLRLQTADATEKRYRKKAIAATEALSCALGLNTNCFLVVPCCRVPFFPVFPCSQFPVYQFDLLCLALP